ncbi:hypothetical protein CHH49_16630 [Terribacillus saccharophilus]|uniref:hypothetical protein n=1 Tax=Terribacillus saccharophilus TaxID=361277 RepID=UPI000BA76A56|nr:hypothetical protein [Terribacillus saccharophilus]PAF20402.1 hypothetical protein CHH49_16630 [Terribacillus saccharophilus]
MKFLTISFLLFTMILVFTGCSETYDEATVAEAKTVTKSYLENNYKNIQIELEEPEESPMGSMKVDGTVNNGKAFSISLNEDLTVASLVIQSDDFPEEKAACREKTCEY